MQRRGRALAVLDNVGAGRGRCSAAAVDWTPPSSDQEDDSGPSSSRSSPLSFARMLKDCGDRGLLSVGRRLHAKLSRSGILDASSPYAVSLGNRVVAMYGKCGRADEAAAALGALPYADVVTWTALLAAFVRRGDSAGAAAAFRKMQLAGVRPDAVAVMTALAACASPSALLDGAAIHAAIAASGASVVSEPLVASSLVNMYGKCGDVDRAAAAFEAALPPRDVVTWNTMIAVYDQCGRPGCSVATFRRMELEGVRPDRVSLVSVLFPAGKRGGAATARWFFDRLGPYQDLIAWTYMISLYSADSVAAMQLYRSMLLAGVRPNEFTVAAVAATVASRRDAAWLHSCASQSGCDVVAATALLQMYGRCGDPAAARGVFASMRRQDVVAWTAMACICVQIGRPREAIELHRRMQLEGLRPDAVAFVAALNAAAACGDAVAASVEAQVVECGLDRHPDVAVGLVALHGKRGRVETAVSAFASMAVLRPLEWTTMVAAYARAGLSQEAMATFWHMHNQGVQPDETAFNVAISACSHAGLVDDACYYLGSMVCDHGMCPGPEHVGCVVDALARAGCLVEAEQLLVAASCRGGKGWAVSWRAFMAACVAQGDHVRGRRVAERVILLEPACDAAYIALSHFSSLSS